MAWKESLRNGILTHVTQGSQRHRCTLNKVLWTDTV